MPLPVIANVSRVAVEGRTANGQPWVNVMHFKWTGAGSPGPADFTALAETVLDLYESAGFGGTNFGWAYYAAAPAGAELTRITPLDGVSVSRDYPMAVTGTTGQEQLPGECATLISHQTAFRGRSNRGRTFWASPYEGMTSSDGSPTSTVKTGIAATFGALLTDASAASWEFGVASYTGSSFHAVIQSIVRPYYAHQDRRRR